MFELFTHRAETLLKEWNCFVTAGDRQVEKNHFSQVKKTWKEPLIGLQHPNIWASCLGHTRKSHFYSFYSWMFSSVQCTPWQTARQQQEAEQSALSCEEVCFSPLFVTPRHLRCSYIFFVLSTITFPTSVYHFHTKKKKSAHISF